MTLIRSGFSCADGVATEPASVARQRLGISHQRPAPSQHGASYGPSSPLSTAPATAASASASILRKSLNEHLEHDDGEASMVTYEYRVTEAADGTFPVELWSSQGDRSQLIYKTRAFPKSGIGGGLDCPVEDRSGHPPSPAPA